MKMKQSSDQNSKKHLCITCNAAFKKVHDLKRHERTHTGERPFKCETCGMSFSQSNSLKIHSRKHTGERPLKCSLCDLTFMYSSTFLAHQKIHSASLKSFVCNFCQCQFVRSSDLKKHEKQHITGEIETLKKTPKHQSLDSEIQSFTNNSYNALSKDDDNGRGGEVIRQPSYSFLQNIDSLKSKSQQRTNSSRSQFLCDVCGTHCSDAAILKDHLKIHSGIKPFVCLVCSRSFLRRSNLKKHEHMHTGEKPHKCKDCGKCFAQFGNLKIHIRIHTGEKPFVCPVCSVRFTHSQALKMHSKIHSGAKPYICADCGSSFRWSASYKSHIKRHQCNKLSSSCEESNSSFDSVQREKEVLVHEIDDEEKRVIKNCVTERIKKEINHKNQSTKELKVLRRNSFPVLAQNVGSCSAHISSNKETVRLQPHANLHTLSQNHPSIINKIKTPTEPPDKITSQPCIEEDDNTNDAATSVSSSYEWMDDKLSAILNVSRLWKNPAVFSSLDKFPVTPESSAQIGDTVPCSSFSSPNHLSDSSGKLAVQAGNLVLGSPQIVEMLTSTRTLSEERWENNTFLQEELLIRNREHCESEISRKNIEHSCNKKESNQHRKSEDECNSHYEELLPVTMVLEVTKKDEVIRREENFSGKRESSQDTENCLNSLFMEDQNGIQPFSELFECSQQQCRLDMNGDGVFSLPLLKCSENKDLRPQELAYKSELEWSKDSLLSCKSPSSYIEKSTAGNVHISNDCNSSKELEVIQEGKDSNVVNELPLDGKVKNGDNEQSNVFFQEGNLSSEQSDKNISSKRLFVPGRLIEAKKSKTCIIGELSSNRGTKELCTYISTNKCYKCEKAFEKASDLQAHLTLCSNCKEALCEECGARFSRRYDLKRHKRIHGDPRPFTCEDCSLSFTQESTLKAHMCTHSGGKSFHCKECDSCFSDSSKLKTHIKLCHSGSQQKIYGRIAKDKTYICPDCSSVFTSYKSFKEHSKAHRSTISAPYLCDFCGKPFLVVTALKCHMAKHEKSKEKFECQICNKQCSTLSNLRKHEKTHSGERPFTCGECGSSFSQKGNLLVHLRIHTGEKPFLCKICGVHFSHSQSLKVHTKFHIGAREFPCQHCGKAFITQAALNKHVRSHTGEKPYKCSICGAQLASSSSLSKHKKMHVQNLPFICQVCEASFAKASHLKVHMGTHNKTHLRSRNVSRQNVSRIV